MSERWLDKLRDPSPWAAPVPLPGPITSGDIVVRPYRSGDGPALFDAVAVSREGLLPWMPWVTTDHQSVDESIYYVERVRRAADKPSCLDFALGIFSASGNELLGGTGFHRIRPEFREAEIGYWVRADRHRSGICTRAIGALISAAFRSQDDGGWGFRRILIQNAAGNIGSRRVCERLGLRLEARMRADRYLEPFGYHDNLSFAVLSHEWDFEQDRAQPGIGWDG